MSINVILFGEGAIVPISWAQRGSYFLFSLLGAAYGLGKMDPTLMNYLDTVKKDNADNKRLEKKLKETKGEKPKDSPPDEPQQPSNDQMWQNIDNESNFIDTTFQLIQCRRKLLETYGGQVPTDINDTRFMNNREQIELKVDENKKKVLLARGEDTHPTHGFVSVSSVSGSTIFRGNDLNQAIGNSNDINRFNEPSEPEPEKHNDRLIEDVMDAIKNNSANNEAFSELLYSYLMGQELPTWNLVTFGTERKYGNNVYTYIHSLIVEYYSKFIAQLDKVPLDRNAINNSLNTFIALANNVPYEQMKRFLNSFDKLNLPEKVKKIIYEQIKNSEAFKKLLGENNESVLNFIAKYKDLKVF